MSDKDNYGMFCNCYICHKEVRVQDCIRLAYDLLYCPQCYKDMVHERRHNPD